MFIELGQVYRQWIIVFKMSCISVTVNQVFKLITVIENWIQIDEDIKLWKINCLKFSISLRKSQNFSGLMEKGRPDNTQFLPWGVRTIADPQTTGHGFSGAFVYLLIPDCVIITVQQVNKHLTCKSLTNDPQF